MDESIAERLRDVVDELSAVAALFDEQPDDEWELHGVTIAHYLRMCASPVRHLLCELEEGSR